MAPYRHDIYRADIGMIPATTRHITLRHASRRVQVMSYLNSCMFFFYNLMSTLRSTSTVFRPRPTGYYYVIEAEMRQSVEEPWASHIARRFFNAKLS